MSARTPAGRSGLRPATSRADVLAYPSPDKGVYARLRRAMAGRMAERSEAGWGSKEPPPRRGGWPRRPSRRERTMTAVAQATQPEPATPILTVNNIEVI